MDSVEESLKEIAKQAKVGSRRVPLVPVLTAAPVSQPYGTQWANSTDGTVSVVTPTETLKLSPFRAGRFRAVPDVNLPTTEGGATFYDVQVNIPRPCRLRTLVEVQCEPVPGGGINGTRTYNNVFCKADVRSYSPAAVVESDSLKRYGWVQDDGGGTMFGTNIAMHRLWNFAFAATSTNYFLRVSIWRQFNTPVSRIHSIDVQFDFVDVVT